MSAIGPIEAAPVEGMQSGPPSHEELAPESIAVATNSRDFALLFESAPSTEMRRDVVLRALEAEPRCGVHLALRYLEEDPPLFYRQNVIDGLGRLIGEAPGLDVMLPFSDPANHEAAQRLREGHGLGAAPPPCAP